MDEKRKRSSSSTATPPLSAKPLHVLPIRSEDADDTLVFLKANFFTQEPLINCTGLMSENEDNSALEVWCRQIIKAGLSLRVADVDGVTLGVLLLDVVSRNQTLPDYQAYGITEDHKFASIIRIVREVESKADIFGVYPNFDEAIDVKVMAFDARQHGRDICTILTQAAMLVKLTSTRIRLQEARKFSWR